MPRRIAPRQHSKSKKFPHISLAKVAIVFLVVICIVFIASVYQKYGNKGAEVREKNSDHVPPRLLMSEYEKNPLSSIEVEVLNGCGEKGIAKKFTSFLRSSGVDVVESGNVKQGVYPSTLIIQRSNALEKSKQIAKLLGISLEDSARILIEPNLDKQLDVTVIVGNDHKSIESFNQFLINQP